MGIHLPSTLAWTITFKFWPRIHLLTPPDSILQNLLKDPFTSMWFHFIEAKLSSLSLSVETLADMNLHSAHQTIRSSLYDLEYATLFSQMNPICSPLAFGLSPSLGRPFNYFNQLSNPQKRRAFMLARLNIFPSAAHFGRFTRTPRSNRLCHFCASEPDSLDHILLRCPTHNIPRKRLLGPLLSSFSPFFPDPSPILLSDFSTSITSQVAEFLLTVMKTSPHPKPS